MNSRLAPCVADMCKDILYDSVQLVKHVHGLEINNNRFYFRLNRGQRVKDIKSAQLSVREILAIPQHLRIPRIMFEWLYDHVLRYDRDNWKAYMQLYTSRGNALCYHYLVYKKCNNVTNLPDYNDYILHHISNKATCICSDADNSRPFDLIEMLVSDSRRILFEAVEGEHQSTIAQVLDDLESDIDDLIDWKIPFRDNTDTHYPISWLLENLESEFRGHVSDTKLDNIINKVQNQMR
jgi:hypothetical protein